MASTRRSIINIDDDQHPLVHLTRQNEASIFCKLPQEILAMIYEYAVAVDKSIEPRQVAYRSNKFVWGHADLFRTRNGLWFRSSSEEVLTVISLGRTCRKIYADLEGWPVFYRVNTFEFTSATKLHYFLAAITRERRAMIRRIKLLVSNCTTVPWTFGGAEDHTTTLLTQCDDLKELSFILPMEGTSWISKRGLNLARGPRDEASPWNLPSFRLKIANEDGDTFTLGDPDLIPFSEWPADTSEFAVPNDIEKYQLLERINSAMAVRRSSFKQQLEEPRPQWFLDISKEYLVGAAIAATHIDLPGESRITHDRTDNTFGGPVSSRTRRSHEVADLSLGILQRVVPKYTVDGVLTWPFTNVLGVRWNDSSEVECNIVWSANRSKRGAETSWEPVEAIMTETGELCLRNFYMSTITGKENGNPGDILRDRQAIPTPRKIIEFAGSMVAAMSQELNKQRTKSLVNYWKKLDSRWASYIAKLGNRVAAYDERIAAQAEARVKSAAKRGPKKVAKIGGKKNKK
ncbi:hypothetical protein F4677DRAFT_459930 [Hypoxylon crocopeplum]|nr:hypothetical protein F4677DRAFT_459930 [Hypoxylon crocopeplum]